MGDMYILEDVFGATWRNWHCDAWSLPEEYAKDDYYESTESIKEGIWLVKMDGKSVGHIQITAVSYSREWDEEYEDLSGELCTKTVPETWFYKYKWLNNLEVLEVVANA